MTEKLLPCPFCGSDDIQIDWNEYEYSSVLIAECQECKASVEGDWFSFELDKEQAKKDVVKKWNTRHKQDWE